MKNKNDNTIGSIPKRWIADEIKLQEKLLKSLEKSGRWMHINGFTKLIEMRQQFIQIAKEKYAEI